MDDHTKPASNSVLRILCVEDNEPDFELVQEYLRLAPGAPDFELRRAESVEEARDELQRARGNNEFDIILTDLSLPGSSGIDTFLAVQAAAPTASASTPSTTAYRRRETRVDRLRAAASSMTVVLPGEPSQR